MRRRWIFVLAGAVALAIAAGAALVLTTSDDGADDDAAGGTASGRVEADEVVLAETVAPGPVDITLQPPADATEMWVAADPSLPGVDWRPVTGETTVEIADQGYQEVFVRYRDAAGNDVGAEVVGVEVDASYGAATASATGDPHQASWVARAAPDVLVVRVETGRIARGGNEPYDLADPPDGDELRPEGEVTQIVRDGQPYGVSIEGVDDHIRRWDRLVGRPLDGGLLETTDWALTVDGGAELRPTAVSRVTRPVGTMRTPSDDRRSPVIHDVHLWFAEPLPDAAIEVVAPDGLVDPITFDFETGASFSPAVHTSGLGHRPADARKVATVSTWPGDGDPIDLAGSGWVVIAADGTEVADGVLEPWAATPVDELGRGDLTGSTSALIDFGAVTEPGEYLVCVDAVGCGPPVRIDDDATWRAGAVKVLRAMYHQRSGIELGAATSSLERPRAHHPDDGVVVRQAEITIDDVRSMGRDSFDALAATDPDAEVVDDAWGGHFDAGDWDRRIHHMRYASMAADVVRLFPEAVESLDLQIPETGDGVPDALADALWTADLYRRLQLPDGAIRGGIETTGHPVDNSASWIDPLDAYVFAPDPWSSYVYAAGAANLARALEPYDAARAEELLASAVAAGEWAEANPPSSDDNGRSEREQMVAAASLFAATGDERWHDLVRDTANFADGVPDQLGCASRLSCDAAWYYLQADPSVQDPEIRDNAAAAFVSSAEAALANQATTVVGWGLENDDDDLRWGDGLGGTPKVIALLRAHAVSGDERFLSGAQQTAAVSTGANPLNTSFITGVGTQPPRQPLVVDSVSGAIPVWPGTPVFGAHQTGGDEAWMRGIADDAGAHPSFADTPYVSSWFDLNPLPPINEFTVYQSHGPTLFALGYLAFVNG